MSSSRPERKLWPADECYLGPVAVAMFVELKWLEAWPLAWTRAGLRAIRSGYGRWEGRHQVLPIGCRPSESDSGAYWAGRRLALNRRASMDIVAPIGNPAGCPATVP